MSKPSLMEKISRANEQKNAPANNEEKTLLPRQLRDTTIKEFAKDLLQVRGLRLSTMDAVLLARGLYLIGYRRLATDERGALLLEHPVTCKECTYRTEEGYCYVDVEGGYKKTRDNGYCDKGARR